MQAESPPTCKLTSQVAGAGIQARAALLDWLVWRKAAEVNAAEVDLIDSPKSQI